MGRPSRTVEITLELDGTITPDRLMVAAGKLTGSETLRRSVTDVAERRLNGFTLDLAPGTRVRCPADPTSKGLMVVYSL
jgi:hypothetical protein